MFDPVVVLSVQYRLTFDLPDTTVKDAGAGGDRESLPAAMAAAYAACSSSRVEANRVPPCPSGNVADS
ncbi:MAG: hypothetical protein BWY06_02772 [Candidatus Latescibacteria bacterium ADurb.Bin168]|nr:MAG: hypothetical protein BWY06_02772 [Candidatus Latescibacteria bacterium ADurb.Bin168]